MMLQKWWRSLKNQVISLTQFANYPLSIRTLAGGSVYFGPKLPAAEIS
jgi:hypothetical protein